MEKIKIMAGIQEMVGRHVAGMGLSRTMERSVSESVVSVLALCGNGRSGKHPVGSMLVKKLSNSRSMPLVMDALRTLPFARFKQSTNFSRNSIVIEHDGSHLVDLEISPKSMAKIEKVISDIDDNFSSGDILEIERKNLSMFDFPDIGFVQNVEFVEKHFRHAREKNPDAIFKSNSEIVDGWVDSYEKSLKSLANDQNLGCHYQSDRTRHYTPLSRLPRPVRDVVLRVNGMVEVDIQACTMNILIGLYLGTVDLSFMRSTVYAEKVMGKCLVRACPNGVERDRMLGMCGRFYRKLYEGDWWVGTPSHMKTCMLSWVNQTLWSSLNDVNTKRITDRLCEIGLSGFVDFVEWSKRLTHNKLHTVMFRIESVIIERLMRRLDSEGHMVFGIHDSVVVRNIDSFYARHVLDEIMLEVGVPQDGNFEKFSKRALWDF